MAGGANSKRSGLLMVFLFSARAMDSSAQTANATQPKTSTGYRIAGTVVSKTDMHPLSRARIYRRDIKERQQRQSVLTVDDGKFEFDRLPARKDLACRRQWGLCATF